MDKAQELTARARSTDAAVGGEWILLRRAVLRGMQMKSLAERVALLLAGP